MILLNKFDTTFFSDKRFPLIPFIESYSKNEVSVSILPGCIICYELNQEFAPIGDEINKFTCKEDDCFILEIEGSFDRVPPRIRSIEIKKINNINPESIVGYLLDEDAEDPSKRRILLARITKSIVETEEQNGEKKKEEKFYIKTIEPNKEYMNLYLGLFSEVVVKIGKGEEQIYTNLYLLN